VEVAGTKYASSEQLLNAVEIDVVATGDSVRVRTVSPSGHRGGHGARYVIRVPRKTEVDRVTSSNGRIALDGVQGAARLRTTNGAIRANGVNGAIDAETTNGGVELQDHTGPATIRTTNGAIRADIDRGQVEASTSNGSITATVRDPEPNKGMRVSTTNGRIELALAAVRNNDIRASTSNSSITLRLPSQVNAQVRAHTSNSSVSTDFDVNVRGQLRKNELEGTIGSGGALIDVSSTNGSIRILRQ
jgi:DUF4097 and DUF4098 domain-containing protein YvlB